MSIRKKREECEGSILLIELLMGLTMLAFTACIVAQYCFKITSINRTIRQRMGMLTTISNMLDVLMVQGTIPERVSDNDAVTYTYTTFDSSAPRIQTEDIPIRQLPMAPYTQVSLCAQWQDLSGEKRTYTITTGISLSRKWVA